MRRCDPPHRDLFAARSGVLAALIPQIISYGRQNVITHKIKEDQLEKSILLVVRSGIWHTLSTMKLKSTSLT
ncbi:hypothetical protein TWF217_000800 [Orbilia oligospora]|nr:hypothetical protein TWF217_000800 [Orbilia oligospora]